MNKEKVALVTGANQGIGLACVELLAEQGVRVVLTSRDEQKGLEALESLGHKENVYVHQLEITDTKSIEKASAFVEQKFGQLDILINNAAINYDTWHHCLDADLNEIAMTMDTNVLGTWRVTQALLPLLRKSRKASIVNVSSGAGNLASQTGNTPGYSLSKLALNGLTMQMANELKKDGILVNSVCPGWVRTKMGGSSAPRSPKKGAETILWAALLEDMSLTGKFFRDKYEISW
jgi:NAD(P)-dependent dehydrogenase (short-subunit alcohol dehydrogenase family)